MVQNMVRKDRAGRRRRRQYRRRAVGEFAFDAGSSGQICQRPCPNCCTPT